ncbi:hypothetical protein Ae201684P_014797 [Aphanomyces euteiches]|uniref:Uncharacterized protein n=1 Tax=Aphanomyces euteiches TaxID=100861 RepID=A0A6G0WXM5_9STRA|nr:hypothetical protein Ae201684_010539 [Aphanomyces euteiches]KAH9090042.1 hypothetical protein Ae201684P_014797 [Aphanomyces euteiches]
MLTRRNGITFITSQVIFAIHGCRRYPKDGNLDHADAVGNIQSVVIGSQADVSLLLAVRTTKRERSAPRSKNTEDAIGREVWIA